MGNSEKHKLNNNRNYVLLSVKLLLITLFITSFVEYFSMLRYLATEEENRRTNILHNINKNL